jgi:sulfate permease, SulP family
MKRLFVQQTSWARHFPPAIWLAEYRASWLPSDAIAGITLAAYAIPVSLAYAGLAGLPPQVGIYGYMLGGVGYALLGCSRQLAIGPTSAISLMIAGSVGSLAGGDPVRYFQIASLAACAVAVLCFIAWLFKLSLLVRLISDSILVGFKAGAGLTIIMTQLPSLFGVAGGGHNFFDRTVRLAGQFADINPIVLTIGLVAILLLLLGERFFARQTGRAYRRGFVNPCRIHAWPSGAGNSGHRGSSAGAADLPDACIRVVGG